MAPFEGIAHKPSILEETIDRAAALLGPEVDAVTVERVVIGLFFTGVKLDNGGAGACATPRDSIPGDVCCPVSAAAMPLPGRLAGMPALDLARFALSPHGMHRAVGIAALNALTDAAWRRRAHDDAVLRVGVDAFEATEIAPDDRVVVVGAFVPFLKQLKRRGQPFLVLEQNPALVNNTLEDLLAQARPDARVTVVGPTVGMLPDAFFSRGADVLGGMRIAQPDTFLDLLAEGASPFHFLGRAAEKIAIIRR